MKLLFIDSETNGLPTSKYAPYTEPNMWPHIIQLSWQIIDSDTWTTLHEEDVFVKPRATWSLEAERIHQIPEAIAARFGKEPLEVLTRFQEDLNKCDVVIGHNLSFDKTAILAEVQRLYEAGKSERATTFWKKGIKEICTMVLTKQFCNVKFKDSTDLKFPRLAELYSKLFNKEYDISGADLHNAKHDVACLVLCVKTMSRMPEFSNRIGIQ
jgi:DNA polymerase III epsilon subunit-like protein